MDNNQAKQDNGDILMSEQSNFVPKDDILFPQKQ
jgi:hypothetical protein